MKNTLLLLLVTFVHICGAMDEPFSLVIDATVKPDQFRNSALKAAQAQKTSQAAVYAALHKIFTRTDSSCIPGHFDHDQAHSVKLFRESADFMQQTGPVYHLSDTKLLQSLIENPDFK